MVQFFPFLQQKMFDFSLDDSPAPDTHTLQSPPSIITASVTGELK